MKLFVEGGGDNSNTRSACTQGFAKLIGKVAKNKPRVVACGARRDAFDKFRAELQRGGDALLLVDSESPVSLQHIDRPWAHLSAQKEDEWTKPNGATDDSVHLMAQCMESWLVADREALEMHFGQGFKAAKLPRNPQVEEIGKDDIMSGLKSATKESGRGEYHKTRDGFALIGIIDPVRVGQRAPHAKRFFDALRQHLGAQNENDNKRNP